MSNNSLSIREVFQYARERQNGSDSLRKALRLDRGDLRLQAKPFPFSVLTYNMALVRSPAFYKGSNRIGAIFELVRRIRANPPDVVGLCEVFSDVEKIWIWTGLFDIYPHRLWGPDESDIEWDSGLLILSKHPISRYYNSIYRTCAGFDCGANKGVDYIRVHPPSSATACDIFFSHTQDIEASGGKNALYAQLIHLNHMVQAFSDPHTPALIIGDLNVPAEVELNYKTLINTLGMPVDLWLAKYPPGTGCTNTKDNNFYRFSWDVPEEDHRLDYILLKSGLRFVPILKNIELLKWAFNRRQISDHFGLRARFKQLLEVEINISGVISKIAVIITGFRCIETTSGPGSDEVSFTLRICDQHGRCTTKKTPIIEDVDNYEYHFVKMKPAELHGDPGAHVKILIKGSEHDISTSDISNIGIRSIQISRMDLLMNKGRSFNRIMPFLAANGEYAVKINVSVT